MPICALSVQSEIEQYPIVLTEASRQHNRNIEDKMRKMHQQLIKDLSDDEINAFIKISDKLINNIKEGL